jgi:hypothetical protein
LSLLTHLDRPWVLEHLEEIVRRNPHVGDAILYNLSNDVAAQLDAGLRIARLPEIDRADLKSKLERWIDDPAVKAKILWELEDLSAYSGDHRPGPSSK